MDPPWNERGGGQSVRGAQRHYPLLKTWQMPQVIYQSGVWFPYDDAHLYMWVTNNFLKDGQWLMEALGFRFVTTIVWGKDKAGIGQYFRGRHELLLFGVREEGSGYAVKTSDRTIVSCHIDAPRGKHSKKPETAYDLVEARSAGPYLELFARNERPGWTSWGNELDVEETVGGVFLAHALDAAGVDKLAGDLRACLHHAMPGTPVTVARTDFQKRYTECGCSWRKWAESVTALSSQGGRRHSIVVVPADYEESIGRATADIVRAALAVGVQVLVWDGQPEFVRGQSFRAVGKLREWDPDDWKSGWGLLP